MKYDMNVNSYFRDNFINEEDCKKTIVNQETIIKMLDGLIRILEYERKSD